MSIRFIALAGYAGVALATACSPARPLPTPPSPAPVAAVEGPHVAPVDAGAPREVGAPAPSSIAEVCTKRFPSAGIRFVETQSVRRTLPPGRDSFMLHGSTRVESTGLIELGPGADDRIALRARHSMTYDDDPEMSYASKADELDSFAIVTLQQGHAIESAILGARPFATGASLPKVAAPIGAWLSEGDTTPAPRVTARAAGRRRVGAIDVDAIKLTAHVEGQDSATCHGLHTVKDLTGELLVRADDGALVEIALAGPEVLVEDVCSMRTNGRERVQTVRARVEIELSRGCFRAPISSG